MFKLKADTDTAIILINIRNMNYQFGVNLNQATTRYKLQDISLKIVVVIYWNYRTLN